MSKLKKTSGVIGCLVASVLAVVAGTDHELKTSPDGLAFISNLEGCSSSAYQCSADRWTAGLGHTTGVKQGDKATTETIADWYIEDISAAEKVVDRQVKLPAGPQYDMAVSFVFNLGAGNFRSSTYLKKLKAGQLTAACNEFLRWVFVNGKDCRLDSSHCAGIVKRRLAEQKVCLYGYQ
ncbi:lysozyme [Photobacterium iliopiscarium]|uniref:Lysozyme n=1 Tax=Photobacterium iliopiscarium TaxID=56192 RepID=A0A2T3MNI5_9GAMM|nr:lysozyme [Photobacterium iliopiscarium]PSV98277.1 lysozyme [Photobacterium iliopiscarium]